MAFYRKAKFQMELCRTSEMKKANSYKKAKKDFKRMYI